MPQVPTYSIDEVDMSELNRIKRALMNASSTNMLKLTNKPDTDPTDGGADSDLRKITQEIYKVVSSLEVFTDGLQMDREVLTFETFKLENITNVKENFKRSVKSSVTIAASMKDITRQLQDLAPNFNYVILSTVTDFKEAFSELLVAYENYVKTASDIIKYLVNDGLMQSKGYELMQVEKMIPQKTKKGKVKMIPSGEFEDPEFKPKITDAIVMAKIKELQDKDNYEYRFNNPKSKEYIDPNDQSDEARIKRDSLEKYYLNTALTETGVGDVLEPSKYETEYDVMEGRSDKDAERRLKTITILNDKIKLVSDPVAKQLKAIISSFMDLQNTYFGLIQNFNEARQQSITPAQKDAVSGGNYYGAGNYLSHPSARELAAYKRSGLPEYI
jgi:hypothetical protein